MNYLLIGIIVATLLILFFLWDYEVIRDIYNTFIKEKDVWYVKLLKLLLAVMIVLGLYLLLDFMRVPS